MGIDSKIVLVVECIIGVVEEIFISVELKVKMVIFVDFVGDGGLMDIVLLFIYL